MKITADQLKTIVLPHNAKKVDLYYPLLTEGCEKYNIYGNFIEPAFLAQLLHESGEFRYVEELASGAAYEGRKDLGNIYPGDGVKFKGRGLIQITGRNNYTEIGTALVGDPRYFINNPEELSKPDYAAMSACWFWYKRGLSRLDDFRKITRLINGGYNGFEDRMKYFNKLKVFYADERN
jgi:putative chitinase